MSAGARKRRAPGTGSIIKLADGTYQARLVVAQPGGGTRNKYARARNEREAKSRLAELKRLYLPDPALAAPPTIEEPEPEPEPTPTDTVDALFPRWQAAILAEAVDYQNIRIKTARDAIKLFERHVLPRWTGRRVADLHPDDVVALNRELTADYSTNTRRLVTLAVRRFMVYAELQKLLPKDTVEKIRVPKIKDTGIGPVPSPEALRALIGEMITDIERHPAAVLVLVAATTGARRSEVAGMQYGDVDWETATWQVQRSVVPCDRSLTIDLPKTPASKRAVPLSALALGALRRAQEAHGGEWVGGGDSPAHPDMIAGYYRKAAKRHGLPTGMHSLRRYVATEVLAQTADLAAAAELLGHQSLETTRRHYVQPVQSRVRRAALGIVEDIAPDPQAMGKSA
jgi:integrase